MNPDDVTAGTGQADVVPMRTIEQIAHAHAVELWGENIGRGEPIPISDADGTYAYVFPFIRGAKAFPARRKVLDEIAALRKKHKVRASDQDVPAAYRAELSVLGSGFGAVCVSARYSAPAIRWASHFLPPYFMVAGPAQDEADRRLGEEAELSRYVYLSPEQQYMEFVSGPNTVVIDAVAPATTVPPDALSRRAPTPSRRELSSAIRQSWARRTATDSEGTIRAGASLQLAPGTGVAPRGIPAEDIAERHTTKKIAYWELIPKVDHTTKNHCVPSSWAMVLGFYDNYVNGKTLLGYGRLIDHWYELTAGGANLPNLIDDLLSGSAATTNKYTFPETKSGADPTKIWNMLKGEVDTGRPCFVNVPGHTMVGFGYHIDSKGDKYAIVYDPPNPQVPTYEHEENMANSDGVGAVVLGGGTPGHNLIIIEPDGGETQYKSVPNEIIWFVWGNTVTKTRVSVSTDGGNTWQIVADNLPTKGAWNGHAWLAGTTGKRVRVKVEGLTSTGSLVAADGSFKNLEVKAAPSGTAWKKIWGPTSLVVAVSVSGKTDPVIFAVPTSGDGVYRYDGTPMSWTKVGGPGKSFVLDDQGHLYGLSPDGSGVYWYTGTPMKWTQIGGPTGSIYAGGGSLFATNPQTGDIYEYQGLPMNWIRIGGPGKTFAVDRKGRLYGVSPDGSGTMRYDGTPTKWTRMSQQATAAIYAGGCGLYAVGGSNNDVYYCGLVPLAWAKVGGPGKMFAVDDLGRLYGLSPDGSGVMRYDGAWNNLTKWTKVGGAAGKIFAGGNGRLFATNPQNGELMSYE